MPAPAMTSVDATPSFGADTIVKSFDLMALHAFRAANVYRAVADVRAAGPQPARGNPVTFTLIDALPKQTTELSETVDPAHVAITPAQTSITLKEYGASTKATMKLRALSFLNLDLEVPREVAANMEESLDKIALNELAGGTRVLYVGQASQGAIVAANTMQAVHIHRARTELARKNSPPPPGSTFYVGFLHPDVAHDLRIESGQQAWSAPQVYREGQTGIWTGELGALGGVRIVENANAPVLADAGNLAVDVYQSIFVGQQALGEAVGLPQRMVVSGPFDDLQRFVSVGWYALLGYGRIREDSIFRIESASSVGANA